MGEHDRCLIPGKFPEQAAQGKDNADGCLAAIVVNCSTDDIVMINGYVEIPLDSIVKILYTGDNRKGGKA